ncbi:MAG TPA: universal stress protein [Chloroflexia bacterium]|nr:universal stress protein [Chloroflexia bacterium]
MQAQILVPLDGSALAEGALAHAQAVAAATGRGLTLLRVVPTPALVGDAVLGMAMLPDHAAERQVAELTAGEDYLHLVAARLPAPVFVAVREGDPATAIVEYTLKHPQVELIAMATHGRTGIGRWVLGSVAEAVLHATPVPVLLIRPGHDRPAELPPPAYRTILVPLDSSAFAEQALAPACALAAATGATLVLLAADALVAERAVALGEVPLWIAQPRAVQSTHLAAYLRAVAERLGGTGIPIETELAHGQPALAILDASQRRQGDLIVMATHGRQGFQRMRLGSVALQVVQGAAGPVLLCRPKAVPARHTEPATNPAATDRPPVLAQSGA